MGEEVVNLHDGILFIYIYNLAVIYIRNVKTLPDHHQATKSGLPSISPHLSDIIGLRESTKIDK